MCVTVPTALRIAPKLLPKCQSGERIPGANHGFLPEGHQDGMSWQIAPVEVKQYAKARHQISAMDNANVNCRNTGNLRSRIGFS
jgi:hypothetical protein